MTESITTLQFPHLQQQGVVHGCFNRHGGKSTGPWSTLNISCTCGDEPLHVEQNKQCLADTLALDRLMTLQQVHGEEIIHIDNHSPPNQQGDAMLTNSPGVGLLIQQADCQAVMLYDPHGPAVANIHVGWRGNVSHIIGKTIKSMTLAFGSKPHQLLAAISPSLGPCCAQFINHQQEFPAAFLPFQVQPLYFDLWQISQKQLEQAGVQAGNIALAQVCTCCDENYFSYRRQKTTGRCATVIGLCHA